MKNNIQDKELKEAQKLFYNLEESMICIAYTYAVDDCILLSLNNPQDSRRVFTSSNFISGEYDTPELLERLNERTYNFILENKQRYTDEEDVFDYIKSMVSKYGIDDKYKYLSGFIKYLNKKELRKEMVK